MYSDPKTTREQSSCDYGGFDAVLLVGMILLVVVFCLLVFTTPSRSHGEADWIRRGGFKNAVGELCCGERDCVALLSRQVRYVPNYGSDRTPGYVVRGDSLTQEFVPESEAQPSPDGRYWRCQWGGVRKCFFVPPMSM